MPVRPSIPADLPRLMPLFDHSRSLMRAAGNINQWVNGYPSVEAITHDIAHGQSFVIHQGDAILGTFAFILGPDPTYTEIQGGSWLHPDRPYGTVHRLAKAPGTRGIFKTCFDWCCTQATSVRADTHADNATMLTLLSDYGFSFRGIIHLADGSPRHAFQLFPSSTLCQPLVDYIEADILPRYDNFDAAHRRDHALSVIANSLDLARHYDVDINMVYTVAAYHDLGLVNGRERHHLDSAGILLADNRLLQWFEPAQLQVMAQAAADHRASSAQPPQTIYGRIVAEADRDIDPLKIIQRTVQFGLDNYPSLSPDQHWQRALAHLNEKYGSSGYLKLFLPESPNAQRLAELRDIIADTPRLREIFNQFFTRFSDSSR